MLRAAVSISSMVLELDKIARPSESRWYLRIYLVPLGMPAACASQTAITIECSRAGLSAPMALTDVSFASRCAMA
jgi:hypothetical protein